VAHHRLLLVPTRLLLLLLQPQLLRLQPHQLKVVSQLRVLLLDKVRA
jgi:hypothetical protein